MTCIYMIEYMYDVACLIWCSISTFVAFINCSTDVCTCMYV